MKPHYEWQVTLAREVLLRLRGEEQKFTWGGAPHVLYLHDHTHEVGYAHIPAGTDEIVIHIYATL